MPGPGLDHPFLYELVVRGLSIRAALVGCFPNKILHLRVCRLCEHPLRAESALHSKPRLPGLHAHFLSELLPLPRLVLKPFPGFRIHQQFPVFFEAMRRLPWNLMGLRTSFVRRALSPP